MRFRWTQRVQECTEAMPHIYEWWLRAIARRDSLNHSLAARHSS